MTVLTKQRALLLTFTYILYGRYSFSFCRSADCQDICYYVISLQSKSRRNIQTLTLSQCLTLSWKFQLQIATRSRYAESVASILTADSFIDLAERCIGKQDGFMAILHEQQIMVGNGQNCTITLHQSLALR